MKTLRPVLGAVGIWLVVVALGSSLVWAVISRAGDGLVFDDPVTSSVGTSPTKQPTQRPTITAGPTVSGSASSEPSGSPSASGSTSEPPGNSHVQRTWSGQGGTLVVTCSGEVVSLDSAQPDPGFAVEIGDRGPEHVEVTFEGREDESENETQVRATCVSATPVFTVETD